MPHDITGEPHWHEPNGNTYAGTAAWNRRATPYDRFMAAQDVPIIRDIAIPDLQNVALGNWPDMGGRGAFIQLFGTEGLWGSYLVEVPGAGALNAERHLYEEIFLVLEGRGTTEIWATDGDPPEIFEWERGSLFSIPLNSFHRIVNSSSNPALLLAGTSAPNIFNLLNDQHVIFKSDVSFPNRFNTQGNNFETKDGLE